VIEIALCLADIVISIAFDCGESIRFSIVIRLSSHHYLLAASVGGGSLPSIAGTEVDSK